MRRILFVVLVLLMALGVMSAAVAAPAEKVDVCHYDADLDAYHLINISVKAFDKHIAHGDAEPGDAVPTMPGYVFDGDCAPQGLQFFECYWIYVTSVNGTDAYDHTFMVEYETVSSTFTNTHGVSWFQPVEETLDNLDLTAGTLSFSATYPGGYTWYPSFALSGDGTTGSPWTFVDGYDVYLGDPDNVTAATGHWNMISGPTSCWG